MSVKHSLAWNKNTEIPSSSQIVTKKLSVHIITLIYNNFDWNFENVKSQNFSSFPLSLSFYFNRRRRRPNSCNCRLIHFFRSASIYYYYFVNCNSRSCEWMWASYYIFPHMYFMLICLVIGALAIYRSKRIDNQRPFVNF